MTTQELKNGFIQEHRRDKRLSMLGFFLVVGVLTTIAILLYVFAPGFMSGVMESVRETAQKMIESEDTNQYYFFIVPIALIMLSIYPIVIFYKLRKRPQNIDELILKIEEGAIANTINQRTVYKITIPLLKINFKLAPVEFVSINLGGTKTYDLPIRLYLIPELKTALSGADSKKVDAAWDELYTDSEVSEEEVYPLKSKEDFKAFLKNDLSNEIDTLDAERSEGKKKYTKYLIITIVVIALIAVALFFLFRSSFQFKQEYILYAFLGVTGLFYTGFYLSRSVKPKMSTLTSSNNSFKTKILKQIIEFVNPNFQFVLHGHISLPELLETGIFESKQYVISGNDQIMGKHEGVPFQLSDIDVQYKRNFSNQNEGPDQVFYGQAFVAKFNKSFTTDVYLIPRKRSKKKVRTNQTGFGWSGSHKTDMSLYTSYNFGDKVELEDPEFMKLFKVYSNDQIEARYILTPSLIDRIKSLVNLMDGSLFISFRNDKISVLNNSARNNFEVTEFKSIGENDNQLLLDFYEDLCGQLSIINDLKLNINIWKK